MSQIVDKAKSGSIFGGMLLIAGSCIGAGMLGLPILTGMAGFLPAMMMFVVAWVFMTITGLLLVEVSSWVHAPANFLSMVDRSLGRAARILSWFLYLFLFYALLVAYLSGSGNHAASFFKHVASKAIPDFVGSLFFVLVFGWVVYLGTRPVDLLNRALMFGKIAAYICLVILGARFVNTNLLAYSDIKYSFFSLPILIISFGFHNMIPSLYSYFEGDIKRIKISILGGSVLTFVIYVFWEVIALGILPVHGANGILDSYRQDIGAAQAIRNMVGSSAVGVFAQVFAFFAILTSFLAQGLSLVHFLSDGFKLKKKKRENVGMCFLALLPPVIFSYFFPQLFFAALNFAGGVCAVILFGIFPVLIVWIGRYRHKIPSDYKIMGGQTLLIAILLFAVFILTYQISHMCGWKFFPVP